MVDRTGKKVDLPQTTWSRSLMKLVPAVQVSPRVFHLACFVSLVSAAVLLVLFSYTSHGLSHGGFQAFLAEVRFNVCHFQGHSAIGRNASRRHFAWNDSRFDILHMEKIRFDRRFKNPCWYEPLETENPYQHNPYSHISPWANQSFLELVKIWRERVSSQKSPCRLRCLPYFLIIGQPKCGSTNLYWKIAQHPRMTPPPIKELHWWSRTRQGRRFNYQRLTTLEDYVDMFDKAAYVIEAYQKLAGDFISPYITGEASVSLFWDNNEWFHYRENRNSSTPRYTNADYIRHFLPDVKMILILRDPVERMYSDYLYFHKVDKSPERFHEAVERAVRLYSNCISVTSARQCVYNVTLAAQAQVRLRVGLYSVYLRDWLAVFPRQQFHVLRLEDYASETLNSLKQIYRFLELDELDEKQWAKVLSDKTENKRKQSDRELGDMFGKTRALLSQFYGDFNKDLAELLEDNRFLWNDQT